MSSILESKTDGFLLTWKVQNINVMFFEERIISPRFDTYNLYKSSWLMSLHSNGIQEGVNLRMECQEANVRTLEEIHLIISVTVVLPSGKEIVLTNEEPFAFENEGSLDRVATFQNFSVSDDTLVFHCHMQKPVSYPLEGRLYFPLRRPSITRCLIYTFVGCEKRCGIWKLEDFASLLPDKQIRYKFYSTYPVSRAPEVEICGTLSNKEKLFLEVRVVTDKRIFFVGKISVLTPQNELKWTKVKGFLVENGSSDKLVFKFPLAISRKCVLSKLRDGDLHLLCEFSFSTGKKHSEICESNLLSNELYHLFQRRFTISKESDKLDYKTGAQYSYNSESKERPSNLQEDLKKFYLRKNHCDITFKIESEQLLAHKSILCSRSPVFTTMFDSDMRETIEKAVEIVDMDADTFNKFLLFLYSDTLEELTCERAAKLLYAANKYQVESLKVACTSFLLSNISVSNVCEVLKLFDFYQEEKLLLVCQNVISEHEAEVFSSKEWESLTLENPSLASKTLREHFDRKNLI